MSRRDAHMRDVGAICPTGMWSSECSYRRSRKKLHQLIGRQLPPIELFSCLDGYIDLEFLAHGPGSIIYFYSGPSAGYGAGPKCDIDQMKAFSSEEWGLAQMGIRLVGVSAQQPDQQIKDLVYGNITHLILADPELKLKHSLDLPTCNTHGICRYLRMAILAQQGQIVRGFISPSGKITDARFITSFLKRTGEHHRVPKER
jgi:peroxiredoxin